MKVVNRNKTYALHRAAAGINMLIIIQYFFSLYLQVEETSVP